MKRNRTQKVLKAIKEFEEFAEYDAVAYYGWVAKDGEVVISDCTICHAALRDGYDEVNNSGLDYVLSLVTNVDRRYEDNFLKANEEMCLAYINFLLHRSYAKDAFCDKNAKTVFNSRVWVINPKVTGNYMLNALVLTRYLSEQRRELKTWWDMVQRGIEENLALLLCHTFKPSPSGSRYESYNLRSNHHSFQGRHSVSDFADALNWIADGKHLDNPYEEELSYDHITMFHSNQGMYPESTHKLIDEIQELVDLERGVSVAAEPTKPFFPKSIFDRTFVEIYDEVGEMIEVTADQLVIYSQEIQKGLNYDFQK